MPTVVAEEELYRSCRIIFGKDLKVSREFLQYLQLSGIKKAYRKKALEIHPDRGSSQNMTMRQSMSHRFIDVHEAYKNLVAYLEARDKELEGSCSAVLFSESRQEEKVEKPEYACGADSKKNYQEKTKIYRFNNARARQHKPKPPLNDLPLDPKTLYRGPIPNCPLLFGRYLYYAGIINLHTVGQALIWQRSQRPRFGEIGRRLGWLSDQDTFKILRNRRERQLFGELALQLGILTRTQLRLILLQQQKLHKRFGQYFVAKNYWDTAMLEEYIAAQKRHNTRVRNTFTGFSAP